MRKIIEILLSWSLILLIVLSIPILFLVSSNKAVHDNLNDKCIVILSEAYDNKKYRVIHESNGIIYIYLNTSSNEKWVIVVSQNNTDLNNINLEGYILVKSYRLYPEGVLECFVKGEG